MSERENGGLEVEGHIITVTHPDKMLWPEREIRKVDYLQKLVALAPYLLPYCRNRYLTTIRYPGGVGKKPFYQKNAPEHLPDYVSTADHNAVRYINLDSLSTLLWLGNLDALEFHPSFEYIGGEEPAEWVLDIDPSEGREAGLMEAVSLIGEMLEGMGLLSVPKTSGATGIQIIVPLTQGYTFGQLHRLGAFAGHYLADKYPDVFTVERRIRERQGRIYVDYVQHAAGKSLAAPYTPRGRPEATVSTPLTWDEVRQNIDPKSFHLLNIEQRLEEKGDLLASVPPQKLDYILKFIGNKPID